MRTMKTTNLSETVVQRQSLEIEQRNEYIHKIMVKGIVTAAATAATTTTTTTTTTKTTTTTTTTHLDNGWVAL